MKKTYKATIKVQTMGKVENRKIDDQSYGMYQYLYIGKNLFKCSLAYISYQKKFEFMVFDNGDECFCETGIKDYTKDAFKKYMENFIKYYLKHGLNR